MLLARELEAGDLPPNLIDFHKRQTFGRFIVYQNQLFIVHKKN